MQHKFSTEIARDAGRPVLFLVTMAHKQHDRILRWLRHERRQS